MINGARLCVLLVLAMFGATSASAAATDSAPAAPVATASATSAKPNAEPAAAAATAAAPAAKAQAKTTTAARSTRKKSAKVAQPQKAASVYLFRGFMGVFSLGMDRLDTRLKANGVKTKLLGHTQWASVVDEIVAEAKQSPKGRYPLVIVGHSLGANAALVLSHRLGELGVPVTLVITVDPTVGRPLSASVGRYLNIYQQNNGFGVALDGGGVSPRRIDNYNTLEHANLKNPEITHFTLDKNADIQKQMYDAIMKALRR